MFRSCLNLNIIKGIFVFFFYAIENKLRNKKSVLQRLQVTHKMIMNNVTDGVWQISSNVIT
jgi:hypothetical protein